MAKSGITSKVSAPEPQRSINYSVASTQIVPAGTKVGAVLKISDKVDPDRPKLAPVEYGLPGARFEVLGDEDAIAQHGQNFLIEGTGAIELWAAKDGEHFLILDPEGKLATNSNILKATTGYKIDGEDTDVFTLGSLDARSIRVICQGKNWFFDARSPIDPAIIAQLASITLGNLAIGDVDSAQRSKLRQALQLVEDSGVSKGFLADNAQKLCYFGGALYGVKRLTYAETTSTNQRSGYEASGEGPVLSGNGSANFANASNQWVTYFFPTRKVFKVVCRHVNNNWAVRRLVIGSNSKNLTAGSGTYSFTWTPAAGWADIGKLQFVDDGGNTTLTDLQVLYADPTPPTLTNGETLAIGDYFKVAGTSQLMIFEGVHSGSGAWRASPVNSSLAIDSALDPISTNAIQTQAVYWAIEALKQLIDGVRSELADVEPPKLVLLDPVADVTMEGETAIDLRFYIDD